MMNISLSLWLPVRSPALPAALSVMANPPIAALVIGSFLHIYRLTTKMLTAEPVTPTIAPCK